METPRVVEITDLPIPEPSCQNIEFIRIDWRTFISYQINPHIGEGPRGHALVELLECGTFLGGGPNDEALHNHPYFRCGISWYRIQEVIDSPWAEERWRIGNKDGTVPEGVRGRCRHVVFALKEGTLDCLVSGYRVEGIYPSRRAALTRALDLCLEVD